MHAADHLGGINGQWRGPIVESPTWRGWTLPWTVGNKPPIAGQFGARRNNRGRSRCMPIRHSTCNRYPWPITVESTQWPIAAPILIFRFDMSRHHDRWHASHHSMNRNKRGESCDDIWMSMPMSRWPAMTQSRWRILDDEPTRWWRWIR